MNKVKAIRAWRIAVAILLVLSILTAYFIPHTHGHGEECVACTLINSAVLSTILLGISLSFLDLRVLCGFIDRFSTSLILHDGTPVWRRVKLSD